MGTFLTGHCVAETFHCACLGLGAIAIRQKQMITRIKGFYHRALAGGRG